MIVQYNPKCVIILTFLLSCLLHNHHSAYGLPTKFYDEKQERYARSLRQFTIVTPVKLHPGGATHELHHSHFSHAERVRRSTTGTQEGEDPDTVHYSVELDGEHHTVSLVPNENLITPYTVVERRGGNHTRLESSVLQISASPAHLCHYRGVLNTTTTPSTVALSTCAGLTGFIKAGSTHYLIEPVKGYPRDEGSPHPHLLYRHQDLPPSGEGAAHSEGGHQCATADAVVEAWRERELYEASKKEEDLTDEEEASFWSTKRRTRRSVSVERNVEVLVVADQQMLHYYNNEDINNYILTVMNMVSSVFHDASIGNAINIIVVKIMLLETPQYEEELHISHHADDTLRSFCNWQHLINPRDEHHPHHHDVAVLLTRYNICSQMSERCSTLGLAEIAGMCHPKRSCNVNEDTGLQIAYTIAHEMGHNFGMEHDSTQNGCDGGLAPHVMSPHLSVDTQPISWSNCSRREVTNFLDRNWGSCLEDSPPSVDYSFPELPPGAMYDASHQCRLSFGPGASDCSRMQDVCQTLWCRVEDRCVSKMEPAAEGTQCAKHKWCSGGKCVTMGERPAAIDGNWGGWSPWSGCSRTCGAGIEVAERHCNNPPPANGGTYCTGDRKKYRICNTQDCSEGAPSFRAVQCSAFDHKPYKDKLDPKWSPVTYDATPCELHCKPDDQFYSEKLEASVTDGTPCRPGTRDMCINGICKRVACDWTIDGEAQEDRCGLCHGDGTQCVTTRGTFMKARGAGYEEAVHFPLGARNIKIYEDDEGGNYLALKDQLNGSWYLNGNLTIQWSGEYSAPGGGLMHYKRDGDREQLFIPGPLKSPLTLMVLYLSLNPGIKWEYTLPHENATYKPSFSWQHSDWSVCSASCGGGSQIAKVLCMEVEAGLVEDKYCKDQDKPADIMRTCNLHGCPAWWWTGPWQPCSITCGEGGFRRRTVICVRSFGPSEQMALLDSDCDHHTKPSEEGPCPDMPQCPTDLSWSVGPWEETCNGDPCDTEHRWVRCVLPGDNCNPLTRPPGERQCGNITCGTWTTGQWSNCSSNCGEGVQFRQVSCEGGMACRMAEEPKSVQECYTDCEEPPQHHPEGEDLGTEVEHAEQDTIKHEGSATSPDHHSDDRSANGHNTNVDDASEAINTSSSVSTTSQPTNTTKGHEVSNEEEMDTGIVLEYDFMVPGDSGNSEDSVSPTPSAAPKELNDSIDALLNNTESKVNLSLNEGTADQDRVSNSDADFNDNDSKSKNPNSTLPVSPSSEGSVLHNDQEYDYGSLEYDDYEQEEDPSSNDITPAERRPSGIVEDKINLEDFEIVEAVNVPRKNGRKHRKNNKQGRKKKNRRKFIIHEGEDAISLLNEIITNGAEETSGGNDNINIIDSRTIVPVYQWNVGPWSNCSVLCGSGVQSRDMQCLELTTGTAVDRALCAENTAAPPLKQHCSQAPCLEWRTSDWSQCSAECGTGLRHREVVCPQTGHCDVGLRPQESESCMEQPCVRWSTGPWSMCTKSCDGGYQIRYVRCVDALTQEPSEEQCPREMKPLHKRACNEAKCPSSRRGQVQQCRDRLDPKLCKRLLHMCSTKFFRAKCCRTCRRKRRSSLTPQ